MAVQFLPLYLFGVVAAVPNGVWDVLFRTAR